MGWLEIRVDGELVYSSHRRIKSSESTIDHMGNPVNVRDREADLFLPIDEQEDEEGE